jgi:signal transduction histidine kinase
VEGEIARILQRFADSPSYAAYRSMELGVVDNGTVPQMREWRATIAALSPTWLGVNQQATGVLTQRLIEPARQEIMLRFYVAGGAGLLAVVAAVALSLLFARRLAQELRSLQRTAEALAHERLPRVVARLRRGEKVDVDAEAPRPPTGRTREIARVTDAFAAVQRTAISTAIGEAELRGSINRVFVNLSWRSQSLLHRQLRLLDEMERRASSPDELEDLFRLDHLTTRMRRHAEGLVILSGQPTMRAWDHPVAAEDVVRAAIAEVEDYTRVEVTGVAAAAVTGAAVADVIHLLAELVENAVAFSPPTTEVTVKVEAVANGLAVEVVDRGIGLHPDEMDELNRRLADAVEFDLVDTDRLGLFVVARLAARHGIQVRLQPSAYGGISAVVLIPHALVMPDGDAQPVGSLNGAGTGRPRPAGPVPGAVQRLGRPSRPALPGPAFHTPPPPSPVSLDDPPPSVNGATPPGDAAEPESSEVTGRLPRRVRQRNLAPQLRRPPMHRHTDGEPEPEDDFDEPSPELSRDLMASLQSGWLRGRAAGETGDESDEETGLETGDEIGGYDPPDGWGRT